MDSVIRLSGNKDIKFSEFYALIEIPLKVAFYEAFWHIWEQENQLQKDFDLWGCLKGQANLFTRAFSIFLKESLETRLRISR